MNEVKEASAYPNENRKGTTDILLRNPYQILDRLPEMIRSASREFLGRIQQATKQAVETGEWEKRVKKSLLQMTPDEVDIRPSPEILLFILSNAIVRDFTVQINETEAGVLIEPLHLGEHWNSPVVARTTGFSDLGAGWKISQVSAQPWDDLNRTRVEIYIPGLRLFASIFQDHNFMKEASLIQELDFYKDAILNWTESSEKVFDQEVENVVYQSLATGYVSIQKFERLTDGALSVLRQAQRYFLRVSQDWNSDKPDTSSKADYEFSENKTPRTGSLRLKYGFFEAMISDAIGPKKVLDPGMITQLTGLVTSTVYGESEFITFWQNNRIFPSITPFIKSYLEEWLEAPTSRWVVTQVADGDKSDWGNEMANAISTYTRVIFNSVSLAIGYLCQFMILNRAVRLGGQGISDKSPRFSVASWDLSRISITDPKNQEESVRILSDLESNFQNVMSKLNRILDTRCPVPPILMSGALDSVGGQRESLWNADRFLRCYDAFKEEGIVIQQSSAYEEDRGGKTNRPVGHLGLDDLLYSINEAFRRTGTWNGISSDDLTGSKAYASIVKGRRLIEGTVIQGYTSYEGLSDLVWKSLEADETAAIVENLGTKPEIQEEVQSLKTGIQPGDVNPEDRKDELLAEQADEEVEKFVSMEKTCGNKSEESLYKFF